MQEWKIYTRKGDTGHTSLIGGTRVPKNHIRVEAYGTIDELSSFVGMLRDHGIAQHDKDVLLSIQDRLFIIESLLARDGDNEKIKLPCLAQEDILFLEQEIDRMEATLPALENFILPGGIQASSLAHVARCICRRAERVVVTMTEQYTVPEIIISYLNRLSDYFFVLARSINHQNGKGDTLWKAPPCDK